MLIKDNPNIPQEDKDFFILLRIGLWQKVEEHLSPTPNWDYIYRLASEQTVQGIICDGIGFAISHGILRVFDDTTGSEDAERTISEIPTIPQTLYDPFLVASIQIMNRNYEINKLQAKLCQLFKEKGITYVVLKGQGVAQCYPNPLLRCSGDIDILVSDAEYEQTKQVLSGLTSEEPYEHHHQKHIEYAIGSNEVEIHAEEFGAFGEDAKDYYHDLKEQILSGGQFRTYECNGTSIQLAPANFDALYIFLHFVMHFYYEGIGMRQIADWSLFLNRYTSDINIEVLHRNVHQLGMKDQWNIFLRFVQAYLGVPEAIVSRLFIGKHLSHRLTSPEIWDSCRTKGNMGHNIKQGATNHHGRMTTYLEAVSSAHSHASLVWKLSHKSAIKSLFRFYLLFIQLGFKKTFRIGGQSFSEY